MGEYILLCIFIFFSLTHAVISASIPSPVATPFPSSLLTPVISPAFLSFILFSTHLFVHSPFTHIITEYIFHTCIYLHSFLLTPHSSFLPLFTVSIPLFSLPPAIHFSFPPPSTLQVYLSHLFSPSRRQVMCGSPRYREGQVQTAAWLRALHSAFNPHAPVTHTRTHLLARHL